MKAIFLDRDGTINKEVNYLYKPSDFYFIPGSEEAIKIFHDLGFIVIVVTNQSGVARGYYTEDDIIVLHKYIEWELNKISTKGLEFDDKRAIEDEKNNGYYIDSYYYCPHHPKGIIEKYAINCDCRKPNTGMVDNAIDDFKGKGIYIDVSQSYIVGDKESDILTGKNAGFYKTVLVCSGHEVDKSNSEADMIFEDLFEFAQSLKSSLSKI
ncbi:HAD family hydrolase [Tissierella sp. DSM 105185]|uniref:D,D-heptose 1,7-bisphosphate phosphatase n=2 Tax=Tissierella pigra TaxID=2607614 RepID=A0A6N7XUT0_9FIRM|nr:HAD family hydrolase [Tissierella pigra]